MLNWLIPACHSDQARSGVSMPPCVIIVMYFTWIALLTADTSSSRSRRSVGSPPVNVTIIGLKNRDASAKLLSSCSFASVGVFQ